MRDQHGWCFPLATVTVTEEVVQQWHFSAMELFVAVSTAIAGVRKYTAVIDRQRT